MSKMIVHLDSQKSSESTPLVSPGIEGASFVSEDGAHHLHVPLPKLTLAEQRFCVWQLVRKVRDLVGAKHVRLESPSPTPAAIAIGLDLMRGFKGAFESNVDHPDLNRVGALEGVYAEWVNEDPSERTSLAIAHDVQAWGKDQDEVAVTVLAEDELRAKGLNLLLAVGQGSKVSPPRLVIAHYKPKQTPNRMLLGKGITFDSGGINVKPYEAFVSMMKNDMAGSALAWALFKGLVEQGVNDSLLLVIPCCENTVGEESMRPGALVKSYAGKTVRIDHTDAEGRLVLADGLAYATDVFKPESVWCFATLTTSALISYGPYATPVHFATDEEQRALQDASEKTGHDLHFFPTRFWHGENNKDKEADLRNTASFPGHANRGAGSRNAAHFLLPFTTVALTHFDIFASAWNWSGEAPGTGYGATGAPFATLLQGLETLHKR